MVFGSKAREVKRLQKELADANAALSELGALEAVEIQMLIAEAREQHANEAQKAADARTEAKRELDDLERQVAALKQELIDVRASGDLQDVALYDYEHPAESSAELADQLKSLRQEIRASSKVGEATVASDNFTFNNSVAKGKKFTRDMSRTMPAAYNAEAENAIKSVKAGGYEVGRQRLTKVKERIEKSGQMIDLRITQRYHSLRLEELKLADRHLTLLKVEKELEKERRAELREQRKAEAELKREQERLEKEKSHYEKVIAELRSQGKLDEVADLEGKLADVQHAIDDVDYRQANIRAGYVYVISNIGAMDERMVKIGMTRRLEPMDRVRELGDASVPFPFDVHALFFADDAVGIEAMLHREFASKRVNRINLRREFFYCTPAEVLEKLKAADVNLVTFTVEPEAEQYRQSVAVA